MNNIGYFCNKMDEYIYTEPTGQLASIEKNFKIFNELQDIPQKP